MIESHFCAATDEAGRVSPGVAPAVKGRGAGTRSARQLRHRRYARKRRQKLKRRAREESADKNRPAPVQAREMGGPKAGLIERPRND